MALVIVSVGINDGRFQAIHKPNRVTPQFSVLETIIDFLNGRPFKDALRILKSDLGPFEVATVFFS
jgi:hypothetical protein